MARHQDHLKLVGGRVAVEDREVNEEEAKRLKEEQDRERRREKVKKQKTKARERRMVKRDQRRERAAKRKEEDELLDKYIDLTVFEQCFELLDDNGYIHFEENADAIVELSDADMKTLHGLFLQAKGNYSFLKEVDSPLVLLQLVGQVLQYGSEQYEVYYDFWKLAVELSADPSVASIDIIDLVIDPIRDLDDVGEVATLDTKIRITRIATEAAKLLQGEEDKEVTEDERRLRIELKKMALDHIRTDPENESLQKLLRDNYHEAVIKSVNEAATVGRAV